MDVIAIIIAGGSGRRMEQDIPKQFLTVNEKPVIIYTLEAFEKHPLITSVVVVCLSGWEKILWAYIRQFNISKVIKIVEGGSCGQESIFNGLSAIRNDYNSDDIVLIHDAIRPMVSEEIITDCIRTVQEKGSAITVIPCAEAMLVTNDEQKSKEVYERDALKRTQTPQGFYLGDILEVHESARKIGIIDSTASCTLYIEMGKEVFFSKGSEKNIKLTTLDDIDIFKALLLSKRAEWLKG